MNKRIPLTDFAKQLKAVFPTMRCMTISPYVPTGETGYNEDGHPILLVLTLYTADAIPELTDELHAGHGTSTGFLAELSFAAYEDCTAGDEEAIVPLDLDAYRNENGYDWKAMTTILD